MSEFPHLSGSNEFPGVENVAPFNQYENSFDYNRWAPSVKITLYNVPWDADYKNVVKFKNDKERDNWFAKQPSREVHLTDTIARRPGETIKLPVPFDEIVKYNYIVVNYSYATSSNNLIDYETLSGFNKRFYFMDGYTYLAPSTTMINVIDDDWTTFINYASIPMIMLERGHYPVACSDVDEYLSDPINNNMYLMGDDINFGTTSMIRAQSVVPLEQGDRYVCFCVPYNISQLANAKEGSASSGGQYPIYSNYDDPTGYQANMSVDYGFYPRDFSSSGPVPIEPATAINDMTVGNNLTTIAVKATDVYKEPYFFQSFADKYPHYFREIKACFIVGADIITLTNPKSFNGTTIYEVEAAKDIEVPIKLNRDMFDIPTIYANLAKLYTAPYSVIEFINPDGSSIEFKPENCGSLKIIREVCMAYPWVNVTAFLTGANGSGKSQITIHRLDGTTETGTIWADDFTKTMYRYDIPTYTLQFSGYIDASINGSINLDVRQRNTKTTYENGVRSSNQGYNATILSNQTSYNNAAASANTGKTNADASADTGKANADASADISIANTTRSNTLRSSLTTLTNTTNTNVLDKSIAANTSVNTDQNYLNGELVSLDNNSARSMTSAQNKSDSAVQQNNAKANLGNSIMQPMIAGVSQGTAGGVISGAIGAIMGAATATITNDTNAANTNIAISTRTDVLDITNTTNTNKRLTNQEYSGNIQNYNFTMQRETNTIRNDANTANTNASNSTANAITNANATLTKNNAARSQSTSKVNATRSRDTSISNAAASKTTGDTNAANGRTLAIQNAQRSANIDWLNAQDEARRSSLAISTALGKTSGDPTSYTNGRCAVRLAVRTESNGALSQAGAYFARYGYAWAGIVQLDTTNDLIQMKNFTYWKATEVWVTGDKLIESARDTIERVLLAGTTVWSDPNQIGEVPINAQL